MTDSACTAVFKSRSNKLRDSTCRMWGKPESPEESGDRDRMNAEQRTRVARVIEKSNSRSGAVSLVLD